MIPRCIEITHIKSIKLYGDKVHMIPNFRQRCSSLVQTLKENNLGAAAFVPGPNFYFLTGLKFSLMERPTLMVLKDNGDILAIMPELEREMWSAVMHDATTFYWQDSDGFDKAFVELATELGATTIGIEGQRMRAFELNALQDVFGLGSIKDAQAILAKPRLIKSDYEVSLIQEAINISEISLSETLESVRIGMSEATIKAMLMQRMLANGADGFAFEIIVLTGGNAAKPHGIPGETRLVAGAPLLIDFGASYQGYSADITRTVFCENIKDEYAEIYEAVLSANIAGRNMAAPSVTCHELDLKVSYTLHNAGFEELTVHKTGHGLGLDIHEAPNVMLNNHTSLETGMLITIEPGLYRSNDIGVRIEDDVLITDDGCKSLTSFEREPLIVGK